MSDNKTEDGRLNNDEIVRQSFRNESISVIRVHLKMMNVEYSPGRAALKPRFHQKRRGHEVPGKYSRRQWRWKEN